MPLTLKQVKNIREEEGTPGGTTYHVTKKGRWEEEKTLCFRRRTKHPGTRCEKTAGFGTWHIGTGACKFHGGSGGRKPTTGRGAKVARQRLATDIQKYLDGDRAKLLDLSTQLATVKVLFEEFVEHFPEPEDAKYGIELHRIQQLTGTIGSLVEKISKIESRNTLTMSQVLYLRVIMTDILMKYVPETARQRAVLDLTQRMGSGIPLLEE